MYNPVHNHWTFHHCFSCAYINTKSCWTPSDTEAATTPGVGRKSAERNCAEHLLTRERKKPKQNKQLW